jgi:hypothetical protein
MIKLCNTKYIINYKYFNTNHRKSKFSDRLILAKKHCPTLFSPQLYIFESFQFFLNANCYFQKQYLALEFNKNPLQAFTYS